MIGDGNSKALLFLLDELLFILNEECIDEFDTELLEDESLKSSSSSALLAY